MITRVNPLGHISLTNDYFSGLVAEAAKNCYGIAAMGQSSAASTVREMPAYAAPMVSFADFSPLIKLVLSFDMLVGRLEIFPMLVLFAPSTWLRSKGHLDRRLRARNLF